MQVERRVLVHQALQLAQGLLQPSQIQQTHSCIVVCLKNKAGVVIADRLCSVHLQCISRSHVFNLPLGSWDQVSRRWRNTCARLHSYSDSDKQKPCGRHHIQLQENHRSTHTSDEQRFLNEDLCLLRMHLFDQKYSILNVFL